jgi:hypothetical protein
MGEAGLPTRILNPVLGRSFTYASPLSYEPTAVGQVTARTLREEYSLDELEQITPFFVGLTRNTGDLPAPSIYNQLLAAAKIRAVYVPWAGRRAIPAKLVRDPAMGNRGIALAQTFSRSGFSFADVAEKAAKSCGIMDTLWRHRGRWYGGWKLGESTLAALKRLTGGRKPGIQLSGGGAIRGPLSALLIKHGYSLVSQRHARADLVVALESNTTAPDAPFITCGSITVDRRELHQDLARRQIEVWLNA